jgi:hypothetical protein
MLVALYGLLLIAGIVCFALHFFAQYRIATILRQRYPDQWRIIAKPDTGRPSGIRTYARLQHVLRSAAPALFEDSQLNTWHGCWKLTPWLAWPCWFAALAMQWAAH